MKIPVDLTNPGQFFGGVALSISEFLGVPLACLALKPVRQCLHIEVTHFDPSQDDPMKMLCRQRPAVVKGILF